MPTGSKNQKARQQRIKAAGGVYNKKDVLFLRSSQKDRCAFCGSELAGKGHLDHIIPIARGGTNGSENLQLLCIPCNLRKGTLILGELYSHIGDKLEECNILCIRGYRREDWLRTYKAAKRDYSYFRRKNKSEASFWGEEDKFRLKRTELFHREKDMNPDKKSILVNMFVVVHHINEERFLVSKDGNKYRTTCIKRPGPKLVLDRERFHENDEVDALLTIPRWLAF